MRLNLISLSKDIAVTPLKATGFALNFFRFPWIVVVEKMPGPHECLILGRPDQDSTPTASCRWWGRGMLHGELSIYFTIRLGDRRFIQSWHPGLNSTPKKTFFGIALTVARDKRI